MSNDISRKSFIKNTALTLAGLPLGLSTLAAECKSSPLNKQVGPIDGRLSLSIFSKHLQWLNYNDMAAQAAQLGFGGVDLTVRAGGHVLPERVAEDLPKAVAAVKQAGLQVFTITTDIKAADEKYTADVLKAASQLGIKNYRMGWYSYDNKLTIPANVELFKKRFAGLAAINERYKIHGDYENHTGRFGNSIWDLWEVLKDLNPEWIGCQFDIHHATIDGAEAWPTNLDLIKSHIGSVTMKDFYWKKNNNKWQIENTPLGAGMVDFKKYLGLLKKHNLQRPISMHYEYPLGGADNGAEKLTMPKQEVIKAMQEDVITLKGWLKESGLM